MVTEDYVSWEVAKLMKDKGFDILHFYGGWHNDFDNTEWMNEISEEDKKRGTIIINQYSFPLITLQMAMKWLREEHELHIEPIPDSFDYKHGDIHDGWCCEITHLSDMSYDADYDSHKKHKTCEEACEDAIKYCLEKLI